MKLVRVPLRISLCGGGSDLPVFYNEHEGACLSFTIDRYIYITAKEVKTLNFDHKYRLAYSRLEKCKTPDQIKHPIIRSLVKQYGLGDLDLDVISDVPAGTGLGSSSAFTVGMHLALGHTTDKYDRAERACMTEIYDLKEPIGKQDQYAAAFGGINLFRFNRSTDYKESVRVSSVSLDSQELYRLKQSMFLIPIGKERSASRVLEAQVKTDNSAKIKQMVTYAKAGFEELRAGNINELGPMIRGNWEIKKSLSPNISNPTIDSIISKVYANGATGAKLLGAGGSGYILVFCPSVNAQISVFDSLRDDGIRYEFFNFDFEGAKVLYED